MNLGHGRGPVEPSAFYVPPVTPIPIGDSLPSNSLFVAAVVLSAAFAWDAQAQWQPPKPVQAVVATLPRGDNPPLGLQRQSNNYQITLQWQQDWPAQRQGPVAPLTLIYGNQPPRFVQSQVAIRSWAEVTSTIPQQLSPNAAWNVVLVPQFVPNTRSNWPIFSAWFDVPQGLPTRLVAIAPLISVSVVPIISPATHSGGKAIHREGVSSHFLKGVDPASYVLLDDDQIKALRQGRLKATSREEADLLALFAAWLSMDGDE